MDRFRLWALALAFLPLLACEHEEVAIDFAFQEAEIIRRDASRWLCGGGWFIATDTDTVTVQQIPDAEIREMLGNRTLEINPPIKVFVTFNPLPQSTCATNVDRVKEISAIHLRED